MTNREVREIWLPEGGQYVDRVHIRLAYRTSPTVEESSIVVHESDHARGD